MYNNCYNVIRKWYGYIIERTAPGNSRKWYLKSVYNGICTWYSDQTYAKVYNTEKAAQNVIKRIIAKGEQ